MNQPMSAEQMADQFEVVWHNTYPHGVLTSIGRIITSNAVKEVAFKLWDAAAKATQEKDERIKDLEALNYGWEFSEISNVLLGCRNGSVEQIKAKISDLQAKLAMQTEAIALLANKVHIDPELHFKLQDLLKATDSDVKSYKNKMEQKLRDGVIKECLREIVSERFRSAASDTPNDYDAGLRYASLIVENLKQTGKGE